MYVLTFYKISSSAEGEIYVSDTSFVCIWSTVLISFPIDLSASYLSSVAMIF